MAGESGLPLAVTGNMGGIGTLHTDQHHIVKGVVVKTRHGLQILLIPVAVKELLDTSLDTVCNLFEAILGGFFDGEFGHGHSSFIGIKNL